MDQRRSRQRGSGLKALFLILFILVATGITIGVIGTLYIYSTYGEMQAQQDKRYADALNAANRALRGVGVQPLGDDADVTFYDDGCIVRGTSYSQKLGTVTCEVSIGITETKDKTTLTIDEVILNGQSTYKRTL